jgi:hypothetical protein
MANDRINTSSSKYLYECRCNHAPCLCSRELAWPNDGRNMLPDWARANFR